MAIFNKDRDRSHKILTRYSSIVSGFDDGGGGVLEKPLALTFSSPSALIGT
jgi:hypothetical protein